ncbi:hypothetical protein [Desulforamulus ferrireducens]|uniref:Uncharacterized protein n=1 Tax=Desulforamulus ferrireducens TaxID=1833852 RepID=A0A1S6IZJ2_9FIRM|nr:hypothetical protein [Desulforamulus ferrireducens]AQS60200.1 hypothetical protein B0537_14600 [Desulforamulus ferrireducens]
MTLSAGERTIYAFFTSLVAARNAAAALEKAGFDLPMVDRTDRYDAVEFLSNSTLHPEGTGEQLASIDFNRSFFLTLKTTDDYVNKAINIIQKHEGIV